jgi:curved DNA-binding protein CbpA
VTDRAFDPYKVLQVDSEAEDEVIQAAYRRLAQKYHPDVSGPAPESAGRMAALNRAWEVLRDPARRRAYDQERRTQARADDAAAEPTAPAASDSATARASEPPSTSATAGRPSATDSAGGHRTAPGHRPSTPPETVSGDWTSGRSSHGGGYDPAVMATKDGFGAAGKPPGDPSGSVLTFGRFAGWSIGEVARRDLEYLEWLDRAPIGRQYRDEIDAILRRMGRRTSAGADAQERRGLFRRR